LATAGNVAALVALPTVERWVPRLGSLRDRAALRKINDMPVTDLADAASDTSRLWLQGAASDDMAAQLDRAVRLYALGDTARGDTLLTIWLNQTGGFPPLPDGFVDLPASVLLKAGIIEWRLNPFIGNPTPDIDGSMTVLTDWLAADRIEGWIILARLMGMTTRQTLSVEQTALGKDILSSALGTIPPEIAARAEDRMASAALVWNALVAHAQDPSLPDAAVEIIWRELSPLPEFAPLQLYCAARCPAEPGQCERAYLQAFGYPGRAFTWYEPQPDAISRAAFYASPRGERVLITQGMMAGLHFLPETLGDAATINAAPAIIAARRSDACFASAVDRVLAGPLLGGR
jgi:hypothetical protein